MWNSIERLGSLITLANWGIAATLLIAFACTVIAIKASSRKDELTGAEDLRKAEHIADLDHANLTLRGQVATLEINAANASKDLAGLQKSASDAKAAQQKVETDLAKQREITANAERSLLELKERIKPRRLTDQQSKDFVAALSKVPNTRLNLGCTVGGGDEAFNLLQQLMPLFVQAKWKVPEQTIAVSSHVDIQVIGIGLLMPGPKGSDPRIPLPPGSKVRLTPAEEALQTAFTAVGMELKFITWFHSEDGTPELVVGSKPNP